MKRFVRYFILFVVMLQVCINCAFASTYPCEGQITKSAVNVRKKANQGSDQVGKLKQNEIVTVVGEEKSGNTVWYKIEFGKGKTGYVRGDLIELRTSITASPISTSIPTPMPTHTPYVDNNMSEGVGNSIQGVNVSVFEKNPQYFSKNAEGWEASYESEGEVGEKYLLVIETHIEDDGTISPSIYVMHKSSVLGLSDVIEMNFTVDDYTCTYSDAMVAVQKNGSFGNAKSMYIKHPSVINLLKKLQTAQNRIDISWRAESNGKEKVFNKTYTPNDSAFIALKEIAQLLDAAGVYKNAYYDDIWLQTVTVQENGKIVNENNGSVFNKPSTWVDMPDQDAINAASIIKICYNYFTDPRGYGSVVKSTSGELTYYILEIKAGNAFGGIVSQTITAVYDTSSNYYIFDLDSNETIAEKGMYISPLDFLRKFPSSGFVEISMEAIEEQMNGGNKSKNNSQTTANKVTSNATEGPSPTSAPTIDITVDEEILFRGIPWGVSLSEFVPLIEESGIKGRYNEEAFLRSWENEEKDRLNGQATVRKAGYEYYSNAETMVAGVPIKAIHAYFAYNTDEKTVYREEKHNTFYFAQYDFKPQDIKTAYDILKEKMTSIYGSGKEDFSEKKVNSLNANDYTDYSESVTWYGKNNTAVRLLMFQSIDQVNGNVRYKYLRLEYGKTNSVGLLSDVENALIEEENNKMLNDTNIDGL